MTEVSVSATHALVAIVARGVSLSQHLLGAKVVLPHLVEWLLFALVVFRFCCCRYRPLLAQAEQLIGSLVSECKSLDLGNDLTQVGQAFLFCVVFSLFIQLLV